MPLTSIIVELSSDGQVNTRPGGFGLGDDDQRLDTAVMGDI